MENGKGGYSDGPYNRTQRVHTNIALDTNGSGRKQINSGEGGNGGRKRNTKRRMPLAFALLIDVLAGALVMLVFFVANYVIIPKVSGSDLPVPTGYVSSAGNPTPGQTAANSTPKSSALPTSTPAVSVSQNSWREKFADKFTTSGVEQTATSYKSPNINVNITKETDNGVVYYIADIYVADLKYFKTAFAKSPGDKLGYREFTDVVAKEQGAVLAINGDHCIDNKGFIVRNGKIYDQTKSTADALVMYYDGTMQTFTADKLDTNKIKSEGAYQVWTFGPMLLQDGQPMTKFNSTITGGNPRTAVGYFEPGHYCFIAVDGRQPGYSDPGYTMEQLSNLFYKLGCKAAFNLDGGQSTEMVFNNNNNYAYVNKPYNGGRSTSDILYITDK